MNRIPQRVLAATTTARRFGRRPGIVVFAVASVLAFLFGSLVLPATGLALNMDQPTFVDDIAPILHENCASCHRPEEIAPMSLRTYREVRPWARSIARAVENRDMPPWDADPGYGPWANDISLSDDEIAAITQWVSTGAPRGDGDEPVYEQPAEQAGWAFGEPDWVYEFDPFDVAADGPDLFAMIPIAPGFEEDRWIRAVEVQPGDREVLHHFILWRASEASTEVQDAWIDAWAAGAGPTVFPPGSARLLPAGRNLLGDFHYHPNGNASTDKTRVGVWFAEPEEVEKELINLWVMNSTFKIPAGDPNHEAQASHVFSQDVVVRSLAPHMHYRGKDMKYIAYLPDGEERELLRVSRFDFNWQTFYEFEEPVELPAGTRIEVTAHWDNSADNPFNPDPTVDVTWGNESTDEMLIGFVDYVAAEGLSPEPVSAVVSKLAELAKTHPGQAWRFDITRQPGSGPEPTAMLLPRDGASGGWFVQFGRLALPAPIVDIVWDGNNVTATAQTPGNAMQLKGSLQEDGTLRMHMGPGEVIGTPAENETPSTLPTG